MVLKFLDTSGNGTDVAAAEAIDYAANHGAKVANASWGSSGSRLDLRERDHATPTSKEHGLRRRRGQ